MCLITYNGHLKIPNSVHFGILAQPCRFSFSFDRIARGKFSSTRCALKNDVLISIHKGALGPPLSYDIGALLARTHLQEPAAHPYETHEFSHGNFYSSKEEELEAKIRLAASIQMTSYMAQNSFSAALAYDYRSVKDGGKRLFGVATVADGSKSAKKEGLLPYLRENAPWCCISNMAVDVGYRRNGFGTALLKALEADVQQRHPIQSICFMFAYKDNEAAKTMYLLAGYEIEERWIDPRWLESAEKGRIGWKRRELFVRHLGSSE